MTHDKTFTFVDFGKPGDVLEVKSIPSKVLGADEVAYQALCFPVNPSDMYQIMGIYPSPPHSCESGHVPGNEGVFSVTAVGKAVTSLKVGDTCLPVTVSFGTWRQSGVALASAFARISSADPLFAASLAVNTATAYRLLKDFKASTGVIIQNGANSQVGIRVIEFGVQFGIETVNLIRSDKDGSKAALLRKYGAKHILLDSDLGTDVATRLFEQIGAPSVAFDCVQGKSGEALVASLAKGGRYVNYGCMSGETTTFSIADFVFRDITACGFWITVWYQMHPKEKQEMFEDIFAMRAKSLLKDLDFEWKHCSDESLNANDEDVKKAILDRYTGVNPAKLVVRVV